MTEKKAKLGQRISKFFKEIRIEMKKVVWPTRKQLFNNTLIVFLACFTIGIVVWLVDFGLGYIYSQVFGK
jgi:preprotein translocase subunit SecE